MVYLVGVRDRDDLQHGKEELEDLDRMIDGRSPLGQARYLRGYKPTSFWTWVDFIREWAHAQGKTKHTILNRRLGRPDEDQG